MKNGGCQRNLSIEYYINRLTEPHHYFSRWTVHIDYVFTYLQSIQMYIQILNLGSISLLLVYPTLYRRFWNRWLFLEYTIMIFQLRIGKIDFFTKKSGNNRAIPESYGMLCNVTFDTTFGDNNCCHRPPYYCMRVLVFEFAFACMHCAIWSLSGYKNCRPHERIEWESDSIPTNKICIRIY